MKTNNLRSSLTPLRLYKHTINPMETHYVAPKRLGDFGLSVEAACPVTPFSTYIFGILIDKHFSSINTG